MSRSHLINANSHRAKEGARVLEDIARFLLRDEKIFQELREIRHCIHITAPIYEVKEDLGGKELIEDNVRYHLFDIIQANAMRLQEALRVLEEFAQTPTVKQFMKSLRYRAYESHAQLFYLSQKYVTREQLKGLYLIIDPDVILTPLDTMIRIINETSIQLVQYRHKSANKRTVFENAYKIKQELDADKLLIINDHIDIALDVADGIHVGQNDYPLERIKNIIPNDFILGISCHNLKEAHIATSFNPSYIAIGCLFETKSKNDITPVSLNELQQVCHEISLPICAIGGINSDNLNEVLNANISMAALISFVWKTVDPLTTINEMHKKIIQKNKCMTSNKVCEKVFL